MVLFGTIQQALIIMYGSEIEKYLLKIPELATHFRGLFAIDQLQGDLNIDDFLIVNTE